MSADEAVSGSFRDPHGHVFRYGGALYRQVNAVHQEHYEALLHSGLYDDLAGDGLLIPHREVRDPRPEPIPAFRILEPETVPFISYPYEWCFDQLKAAALATLEIQKRALSAGLTLRDASAFNIQFHRGRPVLIDTLSLGVHTDGAPWDAYRQFCRHFLAPLALMGLRDVRLGRLLRSSIDGIPLDLVSQLLPRRTWLRFSLLTHIHLHARSIRAHQNDTGSRAAPAMKTGALMSLIAHLESAVRGLSWKPDGTIWGDYYTDTNYSDAAMEDKEQMVAAFCARVRPRMVWDLGANTGRFSRIAARDGACVVALDADHGAVTHNYTQVRSAREDHILPIVSDLTNPSPSLGWAHGERMSLAERGPADCLLALALIHHLAIANNVPLTAIARCFRSFGNALIVEFVPKSDSQVQRLLATRVDIFDTYTREGFEQAFAGEFVIEEIHPLAGSERLLYLMTAR